jgi:hypothetical protein
MPKPKQTMKPVKLPLAKKNASRDIIRRLQQRYKKAEKRNFGKGLSLSTFYQRYYSVKDFDELHCFFFFVFLGCDEFLLPPGTMVIRCPGLSMSSSSCRKLLI